MDEAREQPEVTSLEQTDANRENREKPENISLEKTAEAVQGQISAQAEELIAEGEQILSTVPKVAPEEKREFLEIQKEITDLKEDTQSEITKNLESGKKTPENFSRAAKILRNALKRLEKTAEEGYVFSYDPIMEKTSQGKEIKVDSLSWGSDDGIMTESKWRVVCVATDPTDGKVVGLRLSDIRKDGMTKDEKKGFVDKLKITGEILTRWRGEGIAPALDKAFLKVATQYVNYYKQELVGEFQFNWSVENANLKRLNEKKEQGLSGPELEELEVEQKRWQAVYGEGGKMGFEKVGEYDYSRIVEPQMEEGKSYDLQPVDLEKFKKIEAALEECAEKNN